MEKITLWPSLESALPKNIETENSMETAWEQELNMQKAYLCK